MRRPNWFCSHCGDGPNSTKLEPTAWLHHCLLYTILLTCFLVDTIAALYLSTHRWPLWLTTSAPNLPEANAMCVSRMAASTIAFFTASTVIYRINVGDRCQDHFLLAGISSGVTSGFILGGGLHTVILNVMPWTVMLSLLCSTIYHRIAELTNRRVPLTEEKAPLLG